MDLNLFKTKNINKQNILTVGSYTFTASELVGGVSYNHTVNSGTDIVLGSCTAATIEFQLNNMNQLINNLAGKEIVWKKRVETSPGIFEDIPMGIFIAEKPTKINDTRIKVKAYDKMIKFDIIVDDWLRTVSYPITLKNFLLGLCSYVGVTLSNTTFLNDNYPVKFNFLGNDVKGRDVLKWIAEIAAKFATINELGQLRLGWYNNIVYSVNNSNYYGIKVEDYQVKKIDKLQVQVEENDIGVIVGTGTNAYVIQNNPLLYASTDAEIRPYVTLIYNAIKDFTYIPFEMKVNDNPLIKAGNSFQVTTRKGQVFNAVVMSRRMTDENDVYSATGNIDRSINKSVNTSIKQLRGKTNVLERTVEHTINRLYDADTGDLTQLTQTVNSFNSRVQSIESNMNFKYQQDTPPLDPEIGDIWFNTNPNGFIVDLLTMTVNEMIHPVDYYSATLNKSYRWTGTTWEHVEDGAITELRVTVSEIEQTAENIGLTVESYDGRIGTLELTANSLTSRVSTAEGNISDIIQTADTITSKILNIEGDISSIEQTASSIQSSVTNINGEISTIKQTATGIQTQVTNLKNNTESSITQLSNSINLRVTSGEVMNMLNINTSGVQITASNIDLNGITNVNKTLRLGSSTVDRGEIIFANNASIRAVTGDYGYDLEISGSWTRFRSMISLGSNNHVSFGVGTTLDFYGTQLLNFPDTGGGPIGDEIRAYWASNRFWADFDGTDRITIRGLDGLVKGYINLSSS